MEDKRSIRVGVIAIALCLSISCGITAAEEAKGEIRQRKDVEYGDHKDQKLDLYWPSGVGSAPVMVYVHGGGWRAGDKRAVGEKVDFFCDRGWVFVSINYRLLPEGMHPANVNDVARAIAVIHEKVEKVGGDPDKIFLMGHSAGAHLAALVATAEAPMKAAGKDLGIIKGVIPLDTNVYDLPALMKSRAATSYGKTFGEDPRIWEDASPAQHVTEGKGIPSFLICYSSGLGKAVNPMRATYANAFAEKLKAAGVPAEVVDASDRNHGEINRWFGKADDEKVTGRAVKFLEKILAGQES